MNILYLSEQDRSIAEQGIYGDLISSLIERGHKITLCCADSKYEKSQIVNDGNIEKVEIKVPNQFGVNAIKKGLVLLSLEGKIKKAIKKYLKNYEFDLVIYATPPITLANVVKYCKKKYRCKSYLMLKDIFPQNAVDLHMMSTSGLTSVIYKLFKAKEKKLYEYSDKIGCMSEANMNYIINKEEYIDKNKVELFSNSIIIRNSSRNTDKSILDSYGIDKNKLTFIYGGNLGKPQGLDFLAKAIRASEDIKDAHFIMIGNGGEKEKFYASLKGLSNVTTLEALPKKDYDMLCSNCDIGIIALDYRFTIPNYPSRTLSYLENAMPIFATTDKVTDIKELVEEEARCGKWCYSNDVDAFVDTVKWFVDNRDKLQEMGQNGRKYLEDNFDVKKNIYKLERLCDKQKEC